MAHQINNLKELEINARKTKDEGKNTFFVRFNHFTLYISFVQYWKTFPLA